MYQLPATNCNTVVGTVKYIKWLVYTLPTLSFLSIVPSYPPTNFSVVSKSTSFLIRGNDVPSASASLRPTPTFDETDKGYNTSEIFITLCIYRFWSHHMLFRYM